MSKTNNNHYDAFTGPSSVFKIVKMIMERNFQPVIIFSFSKKECEAYALQVAKLDFNRGACVLACVCCEHVVLRNACKSTCELWQFIKFVKSFQ